MRYADWGERSSRRAGIRSEMVDVCGTSVNGGMFWLDVLRPLSAYGPVVAPDLPGSVFGHTAPPRRRAARAQPSARFLRALTATLGPDRLVLHGWSFGGLVALLFADLEPTRINRLVLTNPTLPGPLSRAERAGWQTLGRLVLLVGPAIAGGLVAVFGSALVDAKKRHSRRQIRSTGRLAIAGGDVSRCSPELTALVTEQLDELRAQPHRLRDGIIAFASAMSAMYVDRRPAQDAIDRLSVPTLLLWGDQDPLIERTVIDYLLARRPDWDLHTFETVGHLPPWEVPHAYAQAVGQWLAHASPSEDADVESPEA